MNKLSPAKIVAIFALLSVVWIVVSDLFVEHIASSIEMATSLSIMKGWLYIAVTAFFLYVLIRQYASQRNRVEEELRESEERWQFALEGAGEGVRDWNAQTNRVYFSKQWKAMIGFEEHEIGDTLDEWETRVHPDDRERVRAEISRHLEGRTPAYVSEYRLQCKDGSYKWILDRGRVISRMQDGKPLRVIGTHADITDRVLREREIKLLSRLYAVLSQVSEAVVRTTSLEAFLDEACRIIVEKGGFLVSWIGRVESDTSAVVPVAFRGAARDYVRSITVYADDRPEGRGPVGNCIRERRPFVYNDFLHDPRTSPWQEQAARFGIRACAGFPIESAERVWGALTIYSDEVGFFGDEDVKLLEEVAGIIGFALDNIEKERLRRQAEESLRESENKFRDLTEKSLVGTYLIQDEKFSYVNPMLAEIFGYTVGELIDKKGPEDLVLPQDWPIVRENLRKRISGEIESSHYGFRGIKKNKKSIHVEAFGSKTVYKARPAVIGTLLDITERKHAEETLRGSEERYRGVVENINIGISVISPAMEILSLNKQMKKWFPDVNVSDKPICYKAFNSPPRETVCSYCTTCLTLKNGQVYETVTDTPAGDKIINYRVISSPIKDKDGRVVAAIEMVEDITERKQAEERIQRQLEKLSALRSIDLAISSIFDIRVTLKVFIEHVITQMGVDAADVLLLNPHTSILEYAAGQGFRTSALRHSHLRLGEGHAGVAALENRIVSIPNLKGEDSGFKRSEFFEGEDFITYYGVPLVAKGHVKGVLEIFHRSPLEPDEEWFEFLNALALQAAIAIDNNSLFYDLERSNMDLVLAYDRTIEGWSRALDYKDKETEGHSQRVTEMTLRIARELGMNEEELVHVRRGALLHDIGKMGIPDTILLKPGTLTEEEWKIMRQHPVYSYELLHPISYLKPALDIPYCHHEKWDGTGYPRGLKGEQIPLSARIFAIVDVWDALRSERPYRPAWSEEKTKEYIRSLSGMQFDPKVIDVFFKIQL